MKKATKKPSTKDNQLNVSGCTFIGVQFDETAIEAITTIAEGLVENAKALGSLAQVLKASNIHIDAMLKMNNVDGASIADVEFK